MVIKEEETETKPPTVIKKASKHYSVCVNPFPQCSHQCEITGATIHYTRQCFQS